MHFLELPKLFDDTIPKDENNPIIEWMMFIDGKSRGVMEMLAEKNEKIKKAFDILQVISQDEKARMSYEAREAEIRDQLTRMKNAREEGRAEGKLEGKIETARNLLKLGMDINIVVSAAELSEEDVQRIKQELEH